MGRLPLRLLSNSKRLDPGPVMLLSHPISVGMVPLSLVPYSSTLLMLQSSSTVQGPPVLLTQLMPFQTCLQGSPSNQLAFAGSLHGATEAGLVQLAPFVAS